MLKKIFVVCCLTFLIQNSCKNSKESHGSAYLDGGSDLIFSELYVQKEIPGTQGEESKTYLKFRLEEIKELRIDSVRFYYNKSSGSNKISFGNEDSVYRIFLGGMQKTGFNAALHQIDSVHVFYVKQELKYRKTVQSIFIKEPIYLP